MHLFLLWFPWWISGQKPFQKVEEPESLTLSKDLLKWTTEFRVLTNNQTNNDWESNDYLNVSMNVFEMPFTYIWKLLLPAFNMFVYRQADSLSESLSNNKNKLSISLFINLSISLCFCLPICLYIHPSVCLPVMSSPLALRYKAVLSKGAGGGGKSRLLYPKFRHASARGGIEGGGDKKLKQKLNSMHSLQDSLFKTY